MNVSLTSASLPTGFCALTNEQWQTLVSLLTGTVNLVQGPINQSINEPAASQRSFPWLRLNADGSPDKIYTYFSGSWISRHPMPPGAIVISELAGADVDGFDGGEAGAVTPISGPMWEEVTELQQRFPAGAGTWPTSGSVISVNGQGTGTTGGQDRVTLTVDDIPAHHHSVELVVDDSTDTVNCLLEAQASGSVTETFTSGDTGGGTSHQNLPPYYTVRFLRRTARLFYRI